MSPLIYGKKQIPLLQGKTVFDYADDLKIRVPTSCGRTGECHECIVEIKQGSDGLTHRTKSEKFLKDQYRLACQAAISDAAENLEFSVLRHQQILLSPTHTDKKSGLHKRGKRPTFVLGTKGLFGGGGKAP